MVKKRNEERYATQYTFKTIIRAPLVTLRYFEGLPSLKLLGASLFIDNEAVQGIISNINDFKTIFCL